MEQRLRPEHDPYWRMIIKQFKRHKLGVFAFWVLIFFCIAGIYAPFLASSKPIVVQYDGEWYFPLFRYLFYRGFFTKNLDIFFNLLIFTLPSGLILYRVFRDNAFWLKTSLLSIVFFQIALFFFIILTKPIDPAYKAELTQKKIIDLSSKKELSWDNELAYMNDYARLNLLLRYRQRKEQNERLASISVQYMKAMEEKWISVHGLADFGKLTEEEKFRLFSLPTLWNQDLINENEEIARLQLIIDGSKNEKQVSLAKSKLQYIQDRRRWLETESQKLKYDVMPLLSHFHWEDDAGGQQSMNQYVHWWDLTRLNRKDLLAALIFGVRISLVVGITAVALSFIIGVPIGAYAGYYGGAFDIVVSRLLEIWEAMPGFLMLLMVVAITQSKSIFLVIMVIGIFGWTGFSRFIRGEFFKQRNLSYVEACRAAGFRTSYIMFSHILPNAIPPLLTLLPFAVMAAVTSEAGLSFLGLGEEGSCSWGVLMDEGRTAFPAESYLLWPPAILLTILLIAIALVGDALRDALDPKMHR